VAEISSAVGPSETAEQGESGFYQGVFEFYELSCRKRHVLLRRFSYFNLFFFLFSPGRLTEKKDANIRSKTQENHHHHQPSRS
jgi:hypothetical protein